MIAGLARFAVELRQAGVSVSPAEWIEALRAAEIVGLDDRERLKSALGCTLVKRSRQRPVFEEVFERFFAVPGRGPGERGRTAGRGERRRASPPSTASHSEPERRLQQMLEHVLAGTPRRVGRLRHVVVSTPSAERPRVTVTVRTIRRPQPPAPRRPSDRRLADADERELAAAVPRLVERIRLRKGRRMRRSSRGVLYLRRVFRENLAHGEVPFVLPRRKRPRRRSRIVLLIDVSWSTSRAAGLFLAIAQEVLRRARDTRVLFFVDRAVDATEEVERWLRREGERKSFARVVESLPGLNLQAPSDYGRAFHALLGSRHRPSGRTTLLIVLGDGRTNRFDPLDWAFEEIAERCGAVLWLVPEPVARWGTGDSALAAYLQHADVAVEAHDLDGLARGVGEIARLLG